MEELLLKYIRGEASPEEKAQVVRWLDEQPENMHQYRTLRRLYDLSLWSDGRSAERKRIGLRWRMYAMLRYVAILLVAFGGAMLYFTAQEREANMQTLFVPSGQRAELVLADGTKVWLNSLSTLRFPERFSEHRRDVELDGEGYFEVAPDAKAPFTVKTYKYQVKVLGTEFNVKAYKEEQFFETSLLKGSVAIQDEKESLLVQMQPNERVSYVDGRLHTDKVDDPNYFRWREGLFCFTNETIAGLIQKLELYYDVKIEIQRPTLTDYHYSGKFRIKDGIEHVLRVLQLKHQFDYTIDTEKNVITIK